MRKLQLSCTLRPTSAFGKMLEHGRNVSESDKANVLAQRTVLGKEVVFFKDGSRRVIGESIKDDEAFNSEMLKLIHASLLINQPVGSRAFCYVDASKDPVYIIIYGLQAEEFITKAAERIRVDDILGRPIEESIGDLKNGCNV